MGFSKYLWRYIHDMKLKRPQGKGILREISPDGYYEDKQSTPLKVKTEEQVYEEEKAETSFDYKSFKKVLKQYVIEKIVVIIDMISEFTKYMKKKDKAEGKVDIKANLQKTINEYEVLIK